jgi:carboxyl-terminal processing protease
VTPKLPASTHVVTPERAAPTFGGLDWAAVARDLRPELERARSAAESRAVIRDMLARLGRSHFVLLSASPADSLPGPATPPFDIRIRDGAALVTRVYADANEQTTPTAGDTLLTIDGVDVAGIVAAAEGGDERLRSLDAWQRLQRLLHGARGSTVTLRVLAPGRGSVPRDLRARRSERDGETVVLGNLPPTRVTFEHREIALPSARRAGLVGFNVWMASINTPFADAVDRYRTHDGLVIDLRGNLGGLAVMITGVAGHLIDEPLVLGTMRTRQAELEFRVNPRRATDDDRRVTPFAGPVAILVDELTGSTSETFAGALQSLGRARVFGRQTMGQALPALTRGLPNGDVLMYAIGDFVTGTGRSLEGAGVAPDQTVALSPEALAKGVDPDLEAALVWLAAASGALGTRDLPWFGPCCYAPWHLHADALPRWGRVPKP